MAKIQVNAMEILYFLLIGGIAGWLAALLIKGHGLGLIGNIIVGIIGAVLGGWLFRQLGIKIEGGLISSLVTATLGAIICLFLISFIKRA